MASVKKHRSVFDGVVLTTRKASLATHSSLDGSALPVDHFDANPNLNQSKRSGSKLSTKGGPVRTTWTKHSAGIKQALTPAQAARAAQIVRTRTRSHSSSIGRGFRFRSRSSTVGVPSHVKVEANADAAKNKGKAKAVTVDMTGLEDDEAGPSVLEREASIMAIGNLDLLVLAGEVMQERSSAPQGSSSTFSLDSIAEAMGVDPCQLSVDQDTKCILLSDIKPSTSTSSDIDVEIDDEDAIQVEVQMEAKSVIKRSPSIAPSTTTTVVEPRIVGGQSHTVTDIPVAQAPADQEAADVDAAEDALREKQAEADATNPLLGLGHLPRAEDNEEGSGCCAICMIEIEELLSEAAKKEQGGIDGGLAVWACEQLSCGTLFCVPCALTWANRAIDRSQHPKCPACTRDWDTISLEINAKALDPTVAQPLRDRPLPPAPGQQDRTVQRFGPDIYQHFIDYEARRNRVPVDSPRRFVEWLDAVVQRALEDVPADAPARQEERGVVLQDATMSWIRRRHALSERARVLAREAHEGAVNVNVGPELQALVERHRQPQRPMPARNVQDDVTTRLDRLFALDPATPGFPFNRDVIWAHVQRERNLARRNGIGNFETYVQAVDNLFGGPGQTPHRRAPRPAELDTLFNNYPAARAAHILHRRPTLADLPGLLQLLRDQLVDGVRGPVIDQLREAIEALNNNGVNVDRARRALDQLDRRPAEAIQGWVQEVHQAQQEAEQPAPRPRVPAQVRFLVAPRARAVDVQPAHLEPGIEVAIQVIITVARSTPEAQRARRANLLAAEEPQGLAARFEVSLVKGLDPIGQLAKEYQRMGGMTHAARVLALRDLIISSRRDYEEMGITPGLLDAVGLPRVTPRPVRNGQRVRRPRIPLENMTAAMLADIEARIAARNQVRRVGQVERIGRVRFAP